METIINLILTLIVGGIGYLAKDMWNKFKSMDKELCSMKAEIVKREEVNHYVEREINHLRTEIKNDYEHLKELVNGCDEKIDRIYELLVKTKLHKGS